MAKRLTYEEVKHYIEVESDSNYKMISTEYINSKTKIKIQCDNGHIYETLFYVFQKGHRCPTCAFERNSLKRTKTNEDFIKEIYDLVGNEYSFLEEYINRKTKIKCKHNKCGHEYYVTPSNFLKGRRCPKCAKPNYDLDTKKFKEKIYNLVGDEYEILGEYINTTTKIKIKHNKCGHAWYVVPSSFFAGVRCPVCDRESRKKTNGQFKKEIYNLVGNEYIILSEYINCKTKIKIKHSKCNHEYYVTPNGFLNGSRCPYCFGNMKLDFDYIKNEFNKMGYNVISKTYKNAIAKLNVLCPRGHINKISYNGFQNGRRCEQCRIEDTFKDMQEYISSFGYILLEKEYKTCKEKIFIKCDKGHIYETTYDGFKNNNSRCPVCNIENIKGENHWNWKGGITQLNRSLRTFLDDWKTLILKQNNYLCGITGKNGSLEIHHILSFNTIVKMILNQLNLDIRETIGDYNQEERNIIIRKLLEYHYTKCEAVPLVPELHTLFHQEYGYGDNTHEQFEDFKTRLKQDEFIDFLEENDIELII